MLAVMQGRSGAVYCGWELTAVDSTPPDVPTPNQSPTLAFQTRSIEENAYWSEKINRFVFGSSRAAEGGQFSLGGFLYT